jgi:hypothetical protein
MAADRLDSASALQPYSFPPPIRPDLTLSYRQKERNAMSQQREFGGDEPAESTRPESAVSHPMRRHGASRRVIFVAVLIMTIAVIGALLVRQVFVAQRIPELTEARLQQAEELWEQSGPASYVMDLDLRGAQPGRVHIEVQSNEITAMTRNGRTPPRRTWRVWSVPGLFEMLGRELQLADDPVHEMGAAAGTQVRVRCEFDAKLGYPNRYHRYMSAGGPEVFWRVSRFEAP